MPEPATLGLDAEVSTFKSTADTVALGDLKIRTDFARNIMILFAVTNIAVLIGLAIVFRQDGALLLAGKIKPT